jgi:2-polyprenyl-3-methyl-5-hydroxy-6-metoxy-1,4-benzoquinol methylase
MEDPNNLQVDIKNWWETNPMTYDWRKTMPHEEGTLEFYREIDWRFFTAAWFAHRPGEEPFSRLIEYPRLRGKRVLEIGCGAGAISVQLAKNGAVVTAIDLTPHAIALTRRRFDLFGLSGDFLQMDAEHLEFPDESFDFVWSWGVIHHSANTEAIIREIHRVLKPHGEARVMVYHRNSINFWIGMILLRGLLLGGLLRY